MFKGVSLRYQSDSTGFSAKLFLPLLLIGLIVLFSVPPHAVASSSQEELLGSFEGTLTGFDGTILGVEAVIDNSLNSEEGPLVAFDGSNYLVTYENNNGSASDIYGRFVSTSGVPSLTNFPISTSLYNKYRPAVYFNGTNYLVVWFDYRAGTSDIYGQILSKNGSLIGPEIPITTNAGSQLRPVIGFNGVNYLIIWWDDRNGVDADIYGQMVSPSGALAGSEIPISTSVGNQQRPEIKAYGSDFFVVWEDDRNGNLDVYGRFVTSAGALSGTEFPIASSVNNEDSPMIGFDGTRFFVVWRDNNSGIQTDIYGQRLSVTGALIGSPFAITTGAGYKKPGNIIFDNDDRYFVVWDECPAASCYRTTLGDIYGRFIKKTGAVLEYKFKVSSASGDQSRPRVAFDGTNLFAVWQDFRNNTDYDVYGQIINSFDPTEHLEKCDGIDNDHDGNVDEGFQGGNTTCGANVEVAEHTPDGVTKVSFSSVSMSGTTTDITDSTGPEVPSGYDKGPNPVYHDIITNVAFTGYATVCLPYDQTKYTWESRLRLLHYNLTKWDDITTNVDTTANIICGRTRGFSPFIVAQQRSTAVSISGMSAKANSERVVLTWSTSSETDNEGFNILRSESADGQFIQINPSMIPTRGGVGMKASYAFTDNGVDAGKKYYYKLQDIDAKGIVTAHNVVSVLVDVAELKGKADVISKAEEVISTNTEVSAKAPENSRSQTVTIAVQDYQEKPVPANNTETLIPADANNNIEMPAAADKVNTEGMNAAGKPHVDGHRQDIAYAPNPNTDTAHSSLSVSIEDKKGNLLTISRINGSVLTESSVSSFNVKEDAGRMIISWKGAGPVKGFVLNRAENNSKEYQPVSGEIPNFSSNKQDIYEYIYIDNSVKPGIKYDYRIEPLMADHEMGMIFKISSTEKPGLNNNVK
ncbi:MAG: hypothetical protein HZA08_09585 [Nitrospirae bacterium]|nr:hypothetical protein [Nitrospirota bacterium]